jgi:hypothetical protein
VADAHPLLVDQVQHVVAVTPDGSLRWQAGHPGQGAVKGVNPPLAVEDHHPVAAVLDDRVKALFFLDYLLVETGVVDGDGGLVGEAGQYLAVVGQESAAARAKDVDGPDQLVSHDQRQGHHLAQPHAGRRRHQVQFHLQAGDLPVGLIRAESGDVAQQRGEEGQQGRVQAITGDYAEAAIVLAQGDEAHLPGQQLGAVLQNQAQEVGQIEPRGHGAADSQQVFSLAQLIVKHSYPHITLRLT